MTRINCVPVQELSDKHLGAEYRELPRIIGLVRRAIARGERPDDPRNPPHYVLGRGHVRFFYPRLGWVLARYDQIVAECWRRGRQVNYPPLPNACEDMPAEWFGTWTPGPADLALNRRRIHERLQAATAKSSPPAARTEDQPPYTVVVVKQPNADAAAAAHCLAEENAIIERALEILQARAQYGPATRVALDGPAAAKDHALLSFAQLDPLREHFLVMYLDAQHRVLDTELLFSGTLSQTSVYPREIVRAALVRGAAAVVFAHNHPSGAPEPSRADEFLTQMLKQALALVDVRVLDHFVVAPATREAVSFAERGLL